MSALPSLRFDLGSTRWVFTAGGSHRDGRVRGHVEPACFHTLPMPSAHPAELTTIPRDESELACCALEAVGCPGKLCSGACAALSLALSETTGDECRGRTRVDGEVLEPLLRDHRVLVLAEDLLHRRGAPREPARSGTADRLYQFT